MKKMGLKKWIEKMIKINEEYRSLYKYEINNDKDQYLSMIVCKNKKCVSNNNIYQCMYNYTPHERIFKIVYKNCIHCNQTNVRIICKKVIYLSKNY